VTAARRSLSLAARLTIAFAAAAFVLALGSIVALDLALTAALERDLARVAELAIGEGRAVLAARAPGGEARAAIARLEAMGPPRVLLRIRASDGTTLAESPAIEAELPAPDPPVLAEAHGSAVGTSGAWWDVRRSVARRGDDLFAIEAAVERRELDGLLAEYRAGAAGVLGGAVLACIAIAYWIARRGVRPIEEVTAAARRVSSRTLADERLDVGRAPAEVAELVDTFNAMLERLATSFQRLKEMGADLAHELRTPLHNLRGEAEVALLKDRAPEEYRDALGSVLEQCGRLSRVIDDILLIERTDGRPDALAIDRFDLSAELDDIRDYFEASAAARGIALERGAVPAGEPLEIAADRLKLRRAIANLVDNAIRYTPEGGRVTLAARAIADGPEGAVEVSVEDTGVGIPPEDLPRAFERFFRVDRSRTRDGPGGAPGAGGVGLGLSIVRTLVRAHGGEVRLESAPGRGTRAIVRLPLRAGSAEVGRASARSEP
jgi:two-component system heavy metal sensor histidine kinase CusS